VCQLSEKTLQNRQLHIPDAVSRPTNWCGSINTTSGNEASQEDVLERSPARLIARTPCRATCALDTVGPDLPEPRCEEVLGILQVKFSPGISLSRIAEALQIVVANLAKIPPPVRDIKRRYDLIWAMVGGKLDSCGTLDFGCPPVRFFGEAD
jgi:hypothetical protein